MKNIFTNSTITGTYSPTVTGFNQVWEIVSLQKAYYCYIPESKLCWIDVALKMTRTSGTGSTSLGISLPFIPHPATFSGNLNKTYMEAIGDYSFNSDFYNNQCAGGQENFLQLGAVAISYRNWTNDVKVPSNIRVSGWYKTKE